MPEAFAHLIALIDSSAIADDSLIKAVRREAKLGCEAHAAGGGAGQPLQQVARRFTDKPTSLI